MTVNSKRAMAAVGEITVNQENIMPQIGMRLYDINTKNTKALDIADIDAIKHGGGGMVLWLLFADRQRRDKAKYILEFKQKMVVLPEFVDGKLYTLAYLYGKYCSTNYRYIQPVIKTDYQNDGFSGQFNFDILPQNQTSFLLTLISKKMDYIVMLIGITRVEYRYGKYTVFFESQRDFLSAQRKTNWSSFGDKGLIIEFNHAHQIVVEQRSEKEIFDEMVFA